MINVSFDHTEFARRVKLEHEEVKRETPRIMRGAANAFVKNIAASTPPCMGSLTIPRGSEWYSIPIIKLKELIDKGEAEFRSSPDPRAVTYRVWPGGKDRMLAKKGYKYKIYFLRKWKKGSQLEDCALYYKSLAAAKNAAKIATRGLLKASWGASSLRDIGQPVQQGLETLMQRSSLMRSYAERNNSMRLAENNFVFDLEITNRAAKMTDGYVVGGLAKAEAAAGKYLDITLRKTVEKVRAAL